jgi:hypothetical protein
MNISVVGSDPQGHLFGTQAIIRAAEQSYAATSGPDWRQAIYWAAFRQELWISLMTQKAFKLHIFPADRSLEPATDAMWATRTIAHLGDVSNFVFGEDRNSIARYNQLMDENKAWNQCRPDSFDPYFYRHKNPSSGNNFPDIRLHRKEHVMGMQYNLLAHTLLIVHDPTIPQLGPAHTASRAVVDKAVQENVRILCGVAQSNPKVFPCKFVACYAIALGTCSTLPPKTHSSFVSFIPKRFSDVRIVGDRFTLREEQQSLRDLWYKCEQMHAFPPTAMIAQLEESWGWHNQ